LNFQGGKRKSQVQKKLGQENGEGGYWGKEGRGGSKDDHRREKRKQVSGGRFPKESGKSSQGRKDAEVSELTRDREERPRDSK